MTFKQLIAACLIETCINATKQYWEKPIDIKYKPNISKEKYDAVKLIFNNSTGVNGATKEYVCKVLGTIFNIPEIANLAGVNANPTYIPFTVLQVINNSGLSNYISIGDCYIVTDGPNKYVLTKSGFTHDEFNYNQNFTPASEEQIIKCINTLNEKQWKTIRTHNIFSPVIDAAEGQEIEFESKSGIQQIEKPEITPVVVAQPIQTPPNDDLVPF